MYDTEIQTLCTGKRDILWINMPEQYFTCRRCVRITIVIIPKALITSMMIQAGTFLRHTEKLIEASMPIAVSTIQRNCKIQYTRLWFMADGIRAL